MTKSRSAWTDRQLESAIGGLLQGGVVLAAIIVLTGGCLYLYRYGSALPDFRVFRGEPTELRNVTGIVTDALAWHSRGIMQMGLIVLMATPVMRVAICLAAFLRQRDRLYAVVTLFVLALLLVSLSLDLG